MEEKSIDNTLLSSLQKNVLKDAIADVVKLDASRSKEEREYKVTAVLFGVVFLLSIVAIGMHLNAMLLNQIEDNYIYAIFGGISTLMLVVTLFRLKEKNSAIKAFNTYKPSRNIVKVSTGTMKLKMYKGTNGTYIHNDTGYTTPVDLGFYSESNINKLEDLLKRYSDATTDIPAILSHNTKQAHTLDDNRQETFDHESKMSSILEEAIYTLDNLDVKHEAFSFLAVDDDELNGLSSLKIDQNLYHFTDLKSSIQTKDMSNSIKQIEGDLFHDDNGPHQYMRNFSEDIRSSLHTIATKRIKSFDTVVNPMNNELERFSLITSYNCYCPSCNENMIQMISDHTTQHEGSYPNPSSATLLKPLNDGKSWECPMCSKQTQTPFSIHKMLDTLVHPSMDRLLQENNNERAKLYLDAESKKRNILSDERKEIRELIENSEHKTNGIQERIRDMVSKVATSNGTLNLLAAELVTFEGVNMTRLEKISSDMTQITENIERHRERTIENFNGALDVLRDEADKEYNHLAVVARKEEEARMNIMREQVDVMNSMQHAMATQTEAINAQTNIQKESADAQNKSMNAQTATIAAQAQQQAQDAEDIKFNQAQNTPGVKQKTDVFGSVKIKV